MTQALNPSAPEREKLDQWITSVTELVDQVETWARRQDWAVAKDRKRLTERRFGSYEVPVLRVRLIGGELHLLPVGLDIVGADGRVDLESFPTLNRVKLIKRGKKWEIITDSNVPLREGWKQATFFQLAHDLLA
jgi:hypothetical protein